MNFLKTDSRSILLTGSEGFLGKNLLKVWHNTHTVVGIDLMPGNRTICCNLSLEVPLISFYPSIVVHSAGKAHVIPRNKAEEDEFFAVNYRGTLNLLDGLSRAPALPQQFIFISTVAVYGLEEGENIDESTPLNGKSPYALSKIMAEELVRKWGEKYNVNTLILRLPLIAGSNPPGNLGSMIKAIKKGYYFRIGDGESRKSMVLASDLASFVASCNEISGIYNLTDGVHPTIRELDTAIASRLNKTIKQIPEPIVRTAAKIGDLLPIIPISTARYKKLTSSLTFSDEKARREIGWKSRPVIKNLEI